MDELVDDFVARRPSGLEQVYALWSRLFFSVARYSISDSAHAEDCVHDALMRVWRSPNRFSGNREMLKAYLVTCVRNESLAMLRSEGRRDAPWNFARAVGDLIHPSGVTRITLHGLRETHASLCAKAAVPLEVVSQRLGHASIGITAERYLHVYSDRDAGAAEAFGRLVG